MVQYAVHAQYTHAAPQPARIKLLTMVQYAVLCAHDLTDAQAASHRRLSIARMQVPARSVNRSSHVTLGYCTVRYTLLAAR
jgi:hypothetical protein